MKNVSVRGWRVISEECIGTGTRQAEPRSTATVPYSDKPALQRYVCHMVAFQSRHPCNHRRGRHQYGPVTTLQCWPSRSTDARRYIAELSSFAPPRAELSTLNVAVRASCVGRCFGVWMRMCPRVILEPIRWDYGRDPCTPIRKSDTVASVDNWIESSAL